MLLVNFTEEENLTRITLRCTKFEQGGSITGETAKPCMLFHINLFSATFLGLQFQEWYLFTSIYQVNTLSKVKILKQMCRRYISR